MKPGIAWVTGASTGIGRALCLRLAAQGWTVAASARDAQKLAALAEEAAGSAGAIHGYALDVTDRDAAANLHQRIESDLGALDLAVLNAGTHTPMPAGKFSAETVRGLVEVNLMGIANCLERLIPVFRARGRGRLMLVASVAGYRGLPTAAAYGASKAAVINMGEALREELLADGVVLQVVNPGFVKTPLTERNSFAMPFLIAADDAAQRIVEALESRRFEITFPKRFTWLLKLARCLPYAGYFALTRRMLPRADKPDAKP